MLLSYKKQKAVTYKPFPYSLQVKYVGYLELILFNRSTTLSVLLKFRLIRLQHSDLAPSIEK